MRTTGTERILVTGGTGMIGSWLVGTLMEEGGTEAVLVTRDAATAAEKNDPLLSFFFLCCSVWSSPAAGITWAP